MSRIPLNQVELANQGVKDRLEMSTAEIGLAVRTTNCLEERGIFTVNDLLHCTREDLLSISNFGEKTLDLFATPTANVEIGNQTFTPAQVGTLNMKGDLEDTAPFLGLGWDSSFDTKGLSFRFIAGAMFTGTPDVSLTASGGTLSNDSNFQAQLAQEEQNLQSDVDDYEIYPVVQLGLNWAF